LGPVDPLGCFFFHSSSAITEPVFPARNPASRPIRVFTIPTMDLDAAVVSALGVNTSIRMIEAPPAITVKQIVPATINTRRSPVDRSRSLAMGSRYDMRWAIA
jgi:hypothetical protein